MIPEYYKDIKEIIEYISVKNKLSPKETDKIISHVLKSIKKVMSNDEFADILIKYNFRLKVNPKQLGLVLFNTYMKYLETNDEVLLDYMFKLENAYSRKLKENKKLKEFKQYQEIKNYLDVRRK